jgi:hypothetical protein
MRIAVDRSYKIKDDDESLVEAIKDALADWKRAQGRPVTR